MNDTALVLRQVRFTNKAFWRNPASAFFTFAFPLMFLVIFTALLGGDVVEVAPGVVIEEDRYFVAAMGTFAVISATYTNLAIGIAFTRDAGILKRTRGTPLPAWIYVTGRVIHAVLISLVLIAITAAFGAAFYAADVPTGTNLLQFLVTIIIGAIAFSALGLATTAIVPNAVTSPRLRASSPSNRASRGAVRAQRISGTPQSTTRTAGPRREASLEVCAEVLIF